MVMNRAKARKIDSNSFCGKVEDVADYLGMDTDRAEHKLVHWRYRRPEGPPGGTHHCTDHSHSHKPGEIKKLCYTSTLCYGSNQAHCSICLHF